MLGGVDIFYSVVLLDGIFGKLVNLGVGINIEGQEMFFWLGLENELFYVFDGLLGLGGFDVFVVKLVKEGFGKLQNVGKLFNFGKDDFVFVFFLD